jgi:catalase
VVRDPAPDDPALVSAAMSAMERYTGAVPGYRRAHAHGHGFVGHFESTAAAAGLSVAEHLQGGRVAVVARLSNGAGSPYAPDLRRADRSAGS